MGRNEAEPGHQAWARFRFAVVARLLASPPAKGELNEALSALASTVWEHPITGAPVTFTRGTIERWYYLARKNDQNPVGALRRKVRKDTGASLAIGKDLELEIRASYRKHPSWSYQLHYDNLKATVKANPKLRPLPSYSTVRRFFVAQGLRRKKRPKRKQRPGMARAQRRRELRETRAYEAEYVGSLWHLDFHEADFEVVTSKGTWAKPVLLGILDDHSRLICHAQWYLQETAEDLAHGLAQAFQKRGLPWEILSDNGSAMIASEIAQGLARLGVLHDTTLEYSPHQNGKQERFWGTVERRLIPMFDGVETLSLDFLNKATQAWVEMDYHRSVHSQTRQTPLERFLEGCHRQRPSPRSDDIRNAFRIERQRTQRKGDGTIPIEGVRFEIPSRYRHLQKVMVRYARWDLRNLHLVDPKKGTLLAPLFPVNKVKNAEGARRAILDEPTDTDASPSGDVAPLLRQCMAEYAATGLPPAFIPKSEKEQP